MRVNGFMMLLAILASALVGYILYSIDCSPLQMAVFSMMFAVFSICGASLSIDDYPRSSMLLKVTSFVFLVIVIILDTILVCVDAGNSVVIVSNGLLLIIALAIGYMLYNSKQ